MKVPSGLKTGLAIAATCLGLCFSPASRADAWPSKPIRLEVPFGAGGTSEVVMRIVATELSARWKVPVVVDNRTGAGGNIGTDIAAHAPPDGYTMLAGVTATHGINVSLYAKLPFFQHLLEVSGFTAEAAKARQGAGGEALSDAFLDAVCLIGPASRCRERLAAFTAAGLDLPILVPPIGVDGARAVIDAFRS